MSVSIWEKESFYNACDVLIVGGGLLGLWTARELKIKRPAQKVTLIDRFNRPAGASAKNAGFACFGSPSELVYDLQIMNADLMWSIVDMRYRGIQKIHQLFPPKKSGYINNGGFECFMEGLDYHVPDHLSMLNKGLKLITGKDDVFRFANDKLADFALSGFVSLVENPLEGGLHSGMLLQSLMAEVQALGVNLLYGLEWQSQENINGSWLVHSTDSVGRSLDIQAGAIIFASNAWLSGQFPGLDIQPARGQIIVSPEIPGFKLSGTFHVEEGFYYFRNLGNRLLLGGARNKAIQAEATLDMQNTEIITESLFEFVQLHLPQAAAFPLEAYSMWSGIMAMRENKQPVLKQIQPGVWAAMCCNGMGVALAPVFAEQVADAVIN